jgi:tetratricopeptide (TPR) repeat protein
MGILIPIVILGVAVGLVTFFVVRSIIRPKKIATLANLVKQKRNNQAIRAAKKIIAQEPRNPDAHYLLGLAYLGENKPELALMELKTVNQIGQFSEHTPEVPFRQKIAELYRKFNQPEEALKEYLVLLKKEPNNAQYYVQTGELFEDRSRSDKAASYYKKAIELDERNGEAYFRLGKVLAKNKKIVEAREYLERAIKLDPDNYEAYYFLGRIQKDAKDLPAALSSFQKAQKAPEYKVKALVERGGCYLSMNNTENAISELERAIKLVEDESSPEALYARYFLAAAFEKNRRIEQAIEQWEQIYKKKPGFRDVAEKLSNYQDVRSNDHVKDFMTASEDHFLKICEQITGALGLTIREIKSITNGSEVLAVEPQSKWRNARKLPRLIRFFRVTEVIDESTVRGLHEEMKQQNINRGLIVTSATFSRVAMDFAESRPIDLYDKDKLQEMLQRIEL